MPDMPQAAPSSQPPSLGELEIHTIPDKFYGMALKAQVVEQKKETPSGPNAPQSKSKLAIIIVVVVLVLGVAGGFVYFNRGLLFPVPATAPVVVETPKPTPPPPAPSAPTDVSATSTNPQTVIVNWTDTSSNESGFRVERNDGSGFVPLTSLPPNSTSFLDSSVQPQKTFIYRIRSLNQTGESDPSNEASVATAALPPPPPEQVKLPPAGLDTDSDGITDLEEVLYVTDPRNPDTDGDGFLDGNEVFNLYNPAGKAPVKLLDSALVKVTSAPVGWVMSVPTSWTFTLNNVDGSKATIDTKHGESFHLSVEENPTKQPILDWYLAHHPGVNATQVMQYRSKGGYTGIIGADMLSTYIPWGDRVFVLTYDLDGQTFINFRTTYSMMLNSLMLSGLPQVVAATPGAPLPFEPSATSSGVVTQPVPVVQSSTPSTGASTSTATTSTTP